MLRVLAILAQSKRNDSSQDGQDHLCRAGSHLRWKYDHKIKNCNFIAMIFQKTFFFTITLSVFAHGSELLQSTSRSLITDFKENPSSCPKSQPYPHDPCEGEVHCNYDPFSCPDSSDVTHLYQCQCFEGIFMCLVVDMLCEEIQPPVQACTVCDDNETPWMIRNEKDCTSSRYQLKKRCNKTRKWIKNKYCQQSCFEIGQGYDGDICCDDYQVQEPALRK